MSDPEWMLRHRETWSRKPLLRFFYANELFQRITPYIQTSRRSLEIGSGPGFFTQHYRCSVVTDVTFSNHIDQVVDAHTMPFQDESFDCVVGIDVLHHLRYPGAALKEIARVLAKRGHLVLIEPWTGPAGYFVNRFLHTEDCAALEDPWGPAWPQDKNAMDGNAMIPKTLFDKCASQVSARTGLNVESVVPFGCLGYLATGGFTRWGLPFTIGRKLIELDSNLPKKLMRHLALKVLIVASKGPNL